MGKKKTNQPNSGSPESTVTANDLLTADAEDIAEILANATLAELEALLPPLADTELGPRIETAIRALKEQEGVELPSETQIFEEKFEPAQLDEILKELRVKQHAAEALLNHAKAALKTAQAEASQATADFYRAADEHIVRRSVLCRCILRDGLVHVIRIDTGEEIDVRAPDLVEACGKADPREDQAEVF